MKYSLQDINVMRTLDRHFGLPSDAGREPLDYLYEFGRGRDLLLYSLIFCPALVEFNGSVILAEAIEGEEEQRRFNVMVDKDGKKMAEESFNLLEVGYIFSPQGRDTTDQEDRLIAEYLQMSWLGTLKMKYPDRKFNVRLCEPGETGSTIAVTFSEIR